MYTNELLQEKYKSQKKLSKIAQDTKKDYFDIIEKNVRELFQQKSWNFVFSKRKGGYLNPENINKKAG